MEADGVMDIFLRNHVYTYFFLFKGPVICPFPDCFFFFILVASGAFLHDYIEISRKQHI